MYNPIIYYIVLWLAMEINLETDGVALIGFGSSRPYNRDAMLYCLDLFKKAGVKHTYHSFIGREEPTIQQMVKKASNDGIERLVVVPFLMATGEMSLSYIPERLGIGCRYGEHIIDSPKRMTIEYLRPIGESPRVADILDDMIRHTPAGKGKKALMLITHGSKIGYRSDLIKLTNERLNKLGYKDIYNAYMEFEEPAVDECAETMVIEGVRHIIAVPLLIASGIHHKDDIPVALGLGEGMSKGTARIWNRDIRIDITNPIGRHPMMKEIVADILENP